MTGESQAQNIFIGNDAGGALSGGYTLSQDVRGLSTGATYSIDGYTDISFAYTQMNGDRSDYYALNFGTSWLLMKEYDGDLLNLEIIPAVQRLLPVDENNENQQTILSAGVAVSSGLDLKPDFEIVPRLGLSYDLEFTTQKTTDFYVASTETENNMTLDFEVNLVFDLSESLAFLVTPAIRTGLVHSGSTGGVMGGVIIQ